MNESKKKLKLETILDQIYRDNCCNVPGRAQGFTFHTVSRIVLNDIYLFINQKFPITILLIDNAMSITGKGLTFEICFNNIDNFTILLGDNNDDGNT